MDLLVLNEPLKAKVKPTEVLVRIKGTATRRERGGGELFEVESVTCDDTCGNAIIKCLSLDASQKLIKNKEIELISQIPSRTVITEGRNSSIRIWNLI